MKKGMLMLVMLTMIMSACGRPAYRNNRPDRDHDGRRNERRDNRDYRDQRDQDRRPNSY